ncbi:DoxX family protein [Flavobacterium macacae]|uniref:DoxX family protein n=1 Tax=Flavobacterium macacae TaxID=2488993 RepID=A0A3P3WCQ6_9FLAO|nr:DoxX family protein [Flavobacterium macacae]RRJ92117.1 DoxX family protein [Flavobacterium macacae]
MMKIFSTAQNKGLTNSMLFLVRATVSCFMLVHGIGKWQMLMSGADTSQFPDPLGVGHSASLGLAVFAEVVCSGLLFVGFATRLVVVPLIVTMIIAVFVIHGSHGFTERELGSLYLLIYLLLFITGSGKYSVDHFIYKKTKATNY